MGIKKNKKGHKIKQFKKWRITDDNSTVFSQNILVSSGLLSLRTKLQDLNWRSDIQDNKVPYLNDTHKIIPLLYKDCVNETLWNQNKHSSWKKYNYTVKDIIDRYVFF